MPHNGLKVGDNLPTLIGSCVPLDHMPTTLYSAEDMTLVERRSYEAGYYARPLMAADRDDIFQLLRQKGVNPCPHNHEVVIEKGYPIGINIHGYRLSIGWSGSGYRSETGPLAMSGWSESGGYNTATSGGWNGEMSHDPLDNLVRVENNPHHDPIIFLGMHTLEILWNGTNDLNTPLVRVSISISGPAGVFSDSITLYNNASPFGGVNVSHPMAPCDGSDWTCIQSGSTNVSISAYIVPWPGAPGT